MRDVVVATASRGERTSLVGERRKNTSRRSRDELKYLLHLYEERRQTHRWIEAITNMKTDSWRD